MSVLLVQPCCELENFELGLLRALVRLSESAFMWSTMVNTSGSVEKCIRKALMTL